MTRFPGATWRGSVPNQGGAMGQILGLVLHIQQGSEAGTDAWFHNPALKVSAHFGNPKSGAPDQWVEVGTVAWAEVDGNTNWISIENEGNSGDSLSASQLENAAQLLAWLHGLYGVPLQISDNPAGGVPGLTGHGLGGAAWGGHTDCPGAPILAQRPQIIARAAEILGNPAPQPPTPNPASPEDRMSFDSGEIKAGFGVTTMICPPPAQTINWGNVWLSFGADFGTAHIRVAAYVHGSGWRVVENFAVPDAGDRVNPFGGPLPAGTQKVSVERVRSAPSDTADAIPLGWLVEAMAK
jgi:hypothetical protein